MAGSSILVAIYQCTDWLRQSSALKDMANAPQDKILSMGMWATCRKRKQGTKLVDCFHRAKASPSKTRMDDPKSQRKIAFKTLRKAPIGVDLTTCTGQGRPWEPQRYLHRVISIYQARFVSKTRSPRRLVTTQPSTSGLWPEISTNGNAHLSVIQI